MCIAISKPVGIGLPSDEILENCWYNNDDGAGFAFNHNGKVITKKGFMRFDDFMKALKDCDKKYKLKNRGVLLHFRIATHGGVNPAMTHPFPIVDDEGCLKKIEYVSDYAIIHNGIVKCTSSDTYKKNGLSDTALFVKDYLSKLCKNPDWHKKQYNIELIENMISSKMAILDGDGFISTTSGFTEDEGVYYSNSSYKDIYSRYYASYYPNYKNYTGKSYGWDSLSDEYWAEYESKYDYGKQDYIAEKVDNAKFEKSRVNSRACGVVEMMKIKEGYYIDSGEFSDYVVKDDGYEYFVTEDGSMYISADTDGSEEKEYVFVGVADVYDMHVRPVPFRADTFVLESQIDESWSTY